ncbi:MAG: M56 family metallopeptidase [bacterium]|nr:M56 family metallopeptidase [bacterium]
MSWLLANTLVAAGLALVVLAIERWGRPAPALAHGLWLVVLLELVAPPLFAIPIDLSGFSEPAASPPRTEARTAPLLVVPERGEELVVPPARIARTDLSPAPAAGPPAPPEAADEVAAGGAFQALESAGDWLIGVWIAGALVVLGATIVGAVRARRRLRALVPVDGQLRAEVAQLAAEIGVVVPDLRDDHHAGSPYVWSLGRARLVLPVERLAACDPAGRAAVLSHELAHLKRRDHWVARAELVLAVLLWWHPLFWFARHRLRLQAELACDALAVARAPEASLEYARVLIDAAARPDHVAPGLAVLASRPGARAAFERRLNMILDDNKPRCVSRLWCVPFAALACATFTAPAIAQSEREPEPIRIEVRINGQPISELSAAERKTLLKILLRQEENKAESAGESRRLARQPRRSDSRSSGVVERLARKEKRSRKPRAQDPERRVSKERVAITKEIEAGLAELGELRGLVTQGLDEARREIRRDPDLRELGITDEVLDLIDGIADGKGIESGLDDVIRAAMKGAGKMVTKELKNDPDLKDLGIADGLTDLVIGFLDNERNQEMIGELANKAMHNAIRQAKREIRDDEDLRRLGITGDIEALIDSVVKGGGDFDGNLGRIVEKATRAALSEVESEIETENEEVEETRSEKRRPRREQPRRTRGKRRIIR